MEKVYLLCTAHGKVLDVMKGESYEEVYEKTVARNRGELVVELDIKKIIDAIENPDGETSGRKKKRIKSLVRKIIKLEEELQAEIEKLPNYGCECDCPHSTNTWEEVIEHGLVSRICLECGGYVV